MKKIKYIKLIMLTLALGLSVTSCMDEDRSDPTGDTAPYGNNDIQETNVISIADLKAKYASTLANQNDTARITDDLQIKARVTGNDIGGNIYSEVAVDDGTGAILICISQGGLFGFLPVGQEILVNLKDLYIGTYGYQPQIGTPYTNASGKTFPSRMNKTVWQQHFKLMGAADASKIDTLEFDISKAKDASYMKENCGRLMVVKGVRLKDADGVKTFAPESEKDGGNGVSRPIEGFSSNEFVVRSSTYADFAGTVMPQEKLDITGIFTRYSNTWQILMRSDSDFKISE